MSRTGRLVFPALRSRGDSGFAGDRGAIDSAVRFGAGGFCIFGGEADTVRELTAELRARSRTPLLIASDLERGAGQQFMGATSLPPLAAIGSLDDLETTRRAARLTAREALALGINWIYAPVADVDLEPLNPIVGSRSFGAYADRVAVHVGAWIEAAQAEGVVCCAKHFPGHGRTTEDSHATLPRVNAGRADMDQDLEPFRSAVRAGVGSIMTAHVIYDAFDAHAPATLSPQMLNGVLRGELGYDGLIVTDGLGMAGLQSASEAGEATAAIAAVNAGCDALLYPTDPPELARVLAAEDGEALRADRVRAALERIAAACARVTVGGNGVVGASEDVTWAEDLAERSCRVARGRPRCGRSVHVLTVDEDAGGRYAPPSRASFATTLRAAGVRVEDGRDAGPHRSLLIAFYSDIRASKSFIGLSPEGRQVVEAALAEDADATIVVFGHERLCAALPGRNVLVAWGGEPVMQRAAARRLVAGMPAA